MKRISVLVLLGAALSFAACNSNQTKEDETVLNDSLPRTTIEFDNPKFDFGTITQGEVVEHTYFFTNTGTADYKIETVQASCGCTTPNYTETAVKPGEKGNIVVKFNSAGRSGNQSKTVTVYGNSEEGKIQLSFTAKITVPENK
ncbi:MAG TPA: DUF1573 domain-containing protein [Bacteroidales bacterium]|nr:MAG: hypothetical protein BWY22_01882 [Bacteroidetes bacterium ADurb.Bin217]HPM13191.1 DUF1573 domain-containing protein [Bacteroidales bacterium]